MVCHIINRSMHIFVGFVTISHQALMTSYLVLRKIQERPTCHIFNQLEGANRPPVTSKGVRQRRAPMLTSLCRVLGSLSTLIAALKRSLHIPKFALDEIPTLIAFLKIINGTFQDYFSSQLLTEHFVFQCHDSGESSDVWCSVLKE